MTQDNDVAAVLAEALITKRRLGRSGAWTEAEYCAELADAALQALTATGYAVVAVPESVAVHPHYTSTYCIHDLHDDCRLTCKHCKERCRCACHIEDTP